MQNDDRDGYKETVTWAFLFTFVKCFTKNKKVNYKCLLFIDKEESWEEGVFYAHSIRQNPFVYMPVKLLVFKGFI